MCRCGRTHSNLELNTSASQDFVKYSTANASLRHTTCSHETQENFVEELSLAISRRNNVAPFSGTSPAGQLHDTSRTPKSPAKKAAPRVHVAGRERARLPVIPETEGQPSILCLRNSACVWSYDSQSASPWAGAACNFECNSSRQRRPSPARPAKNAAYRTCSLVAKPFQSRSTLTCPIYTAGSSTTTAVPGHVTGHSYSTR